MQLRVKFTSPEKSHCVISSALDLTDNGQALHNKNYPTCLSTCKVTYLCSQSLFPLTTLSFQHLCASMHNKLSVMYSSNQVTPRLQTLGQCLWRKPPWEEKLILCYTMNSTGGQMPEGSEKQTCVSEPYDQGSG